MTNMETKLALQMCKSFSDFDTIMNQTWCKTDSDKIEYLQQMFDVSVVHATDDNRHTDYVAIANAIMNHS